MADDIPLNVPPQVASFLRNLNDKQARQQSQFEALAKAYRELRTRSEGDKLEIQRLGEWVRKAASRIRYIEDIPGKRVPYTMNFEVSIPSVANVANPVGARIRAQQQVSMDGPFVGTMLMGAFRMQTFSLGPIADVAPNLPPVGEEVLTPLTGRFRPIASTADAFQGAYIGPGAGLTPTDVNTFRPGEIDFLWEYADEGTDRERQNQIPTPSRYLFSENDRPFYLAVSDFFERGSTIAFYTTLLRSVGLVEVNFSTGWNGYTESPIAPADRVLLALGGTLTLSIHGYKILQAQSPAV
jgi:hypothetical protein